MLADDLQEKIAEWKRLVKVATRGPWENAGDEEEGIFFVAAREAVPALIAACEELQQENVELQSFARKGVCLYCGTVSEAADSSWEAKKQMAAEHITDCEKHPLRQATEILVGVQQREAKCREAVDKLSHDQCSSPYCLASSHLECGGATAPHEHGCRLCAILAILDGEKE